MLEEKRVLPLIRLSEHKEALLKYYICILELELTVPPSRAYNNMCYLIDKYAPIEGIDKYDPRLDPSVTGAHFEVYSAAD